jgi:hypothetical protein
LVDLQFSQLGLPFCSASEARPAKHENAGHHSQQEPRLPLVLHQRAERDNQRQRNQQQHVDLQEVGEAIRVLEGVRRVGVVVAATVGTELLDRLLRGHRATGDLLFHHLARRVDRGCRRVAVEVLHNALRHQHDRRDERQRQEDA